MWLQKRIFWYSWAPRCVLNAILHLQIAHFKANWKNKDRELTQISVSHQWETLYRTASEKTPQDYKQKDRRRMDTYNQDICSKAHKTNVMQITWWVPVRGGEAPWKAGRSRAYASCSAAHWTWDADGTGSNHCLTARGRSAPPRFSVSRHIPAPMGLSYSRIVNNGGQQSREGPQQESGEELADDWALQGGEGNHCWRRA